MDWCISLEVTTILYELGCGLGLSYVIFTHCQDEAKGVIRCALYEILTKCSLGFLGGMNREQMYDHWYHFFSREEELKRFVQ